MGRAVGQQRGAPAGRSSSSHDGSWGSIDGNLGSGDDLGSEAIGVSSGGGDAVGVGQDLGLRGGHTNSQKDL